MTIKQVMLALALAGPLSVNAGVIALWDFNDQNMTVDQGAGSLSISGTPGFYVRGTGDYDLGFGGAGSQYFTIQVTGTGLSGFAVSYDGQSALGTPSQTWEYSVNGSTWASTGVTQPGQLVNGVWNTYSVDFSGVSSLNGASTVYLRDTVTTGTSFIGYFDNIQVTAVPEPVNVAMGIFGLGLVGTTAGRRFLAKRAKKA